MPQKRLLVDMDGTLARFHDEANYLERMFEQGFFEHLAPFENMVEAIRLFIQYYPEIPVCPCSAAIQSPYCKEEKDTWLDRRLPEIPVEHRIYTEMGRSKAEYLPGGVTKDDYLLDDYNRGLHQFLFDGGSSIKCHNNINQKGMGAHGGERGYMWEGPMIHADDPPELIVAELASLMGLEHNLKKPAQACQVQYSETEQDAASQKAPRRGKFLTCLSDNEKSLYAASDMTGAAPWNTYFQNPFNALRWLNNDPLASEYHLRTNEGEALTVSGYQLEAICRNAYGNSNFRQYLRADRVQLADDVKKALEHRTDAVVGFLFQVDSAGLEYNMIPYYDHASMLKEIEKYQSRGQPYQAEWFVEPPELHQEQSKKETHLSFDAALEDAKRRAMEAQSGGAPGKEPGLQ